MRLHEKSKTWATRGISWRSYEGARPESEREAELLFVPKLLLALALAFGMVIGGLKHIDEAVHTWRLITSQSYRNSIIQNSPAAAGTHNEADESIITRNAEQSYADH